MLVPASTAKQAPAQSGRTPGPLADAACRSGYTHEWVYGDYVDQLRQVGEMRKLEVEVIA
jgi:hypothetical protein